MSLHLPKRIKLGKRHLPLPRSRVLRLVLGVALIVCGILGFLPIIGFWMLPLGLMVLSVDVAQIRRWRRRGEVRFGRWRRRGEAGNSSTVGAVSGE